MKSKRFLKPLVAATLVLTLMGGSAGCHPRFARLIAAGLIAVAAVAVVAHHDAHFHDRYCGHSYVVVEDRDVYEYEGRWEYYDEGSGQWYYYEEPPVPDETYEEHYYYYDNR